MNLNFKDFSELEKKQLYMLTVRPVTNMRALFSDETENYRIPAEPSTNQMVKIRFRTEKNNVDHVYLVSGDAKTEMKKFKTEGFFDYYEIEVFIGTEVYYYFFEIQTGGLSCYYNKLGVSMRLENYYSFVIYPGFNTPDWAKGAVIYQIFVDRFCNGDTSNDVEDREYYYIGAGSVRVKDWSQYPSTMDVRSFYGGDLQGVWDKLDYLQDLGIEVIYFNPMFVSPSNHKYDSQDYDYIDPHYGKIVHDGGEVLAEGDDDNKHATKYIKRVTDKANLEASNEFFAQLVSEVHRRGMKVIIDGVFNHCGSFNKWMDREQIYEGEEGYEKGAYVSENSIYRSFFHFHNNDAWPYNKSYDGWWGHDTLPKLNYEDSPLLYEYILDIAKKWVSPPYNADGWRLDVAADLGHSDHFNHQFWKDFRKAVKGANPNAIILAEHYGDPNQWLQGDEWDTVMNYDAFMEPLTWFLTGMEKHSDAYDGGLLGNAQSFVDAMRYHMAAFSTPSLFTAMNELSNHDHSRFLTRTNHVVGRIGGKSPEDAERGVDKAVLREAVVIQMTWPGAPTLYYGDEAGLCGFTDPDNRRTYPWGKEDFELIDFHKEIIRIHKQNRVLKFGSLVFLEYGYQFLSYARFNKESQIVVAVNNHPEQEKEIDLPVWQANIPLNCEMEQLMFTTSSYYSIGIVKHKVNAGRIHLKMPKTSAIVLRAVKQAEE